MEQVPTDPSTKETNFYLNCTQGLDVQNAACLSNC